MDPHPGRAAMVRPFSVFLSLFSFLCFPFSVFLSLFSFLCFPFSVFLPLFFFPEVSGESRDMRKGRPRVEPAH